MSTTLTKLEEDLPVAMKAHDAFRVGTLRQTIAAIRGEAKAGSVERELTEDDVLKVLAREVKKRRESAQIYADAGAADRAKVESDEADLIGEYLPAQLSDAELEALVREAISATGASSLRDMGGVMKYVTTKAGTAADGKKVSMLVRAALSA
jgi:uncharacterized protein